MASSTTTGPSAAAFSGMRWDVDNPRVRVDRTGDPMPSVQVQHLDYPYDVTLPTSPPEFSDYCALAYEYLAAVNGKLGIDVGLLDGLKPDAPNAKLLDLRWLAIDGDPSHSFWLNRFDFGHASPGSGSAAVVDRTLVLLAGLNWLTTQPLNGGQGIRILVQVRATPAGAVVLRFTGVTSTAPSFSPSLSLQALAATFTQALFARLLALARQGIPSNNTLVDIGLAILPDVQNPTGRRIRVELRATTALPPSTGRDSTQLDATSHRLVTRADFDQDGNETLSVALQPLIAFAQPQAQVMKKDPVSQQGASSYWDNRPSLPTGKLDPAREPELWGNLPSTAGMVELTDGEVLVRNVRLIDAPSFAEGTPKQVPETSDAAVRSNEFTAVSAFFHGRSLLRRMRGHGLLPSDLLRYVSLPLDIHYRAGILPGYGDGRTVNAQVRWAISVPEAPAAPAPEPLPQRRLELRFALGDLSMTAGRLPANLATADARQPLGIAIEPRWCWHEFGHVLIGGSTGELELPFAHSVGDALAAIECDPASALACDDQGAADNSGAWRHATFPWVHIPRRHDRDVQQGWSWTETVSGVTAPHGYRSEQLMSTSLFRLYRALGGDSMQTNLAGIKVPARVQRQQASDYVSYLIMRTVASLGPANVSPCASVHIFVHAMRSVDCATSGRPGPGGYVGGTANKVIQWAFERQGLYGKPLPDSPIIGPDGRHGGSPEVDLQIEDQRPTRDGPYAPVDLLGTAWFAAPGAIEVRRENPQSFQRQRIDVTVLNRGCDAAVATEVQVWCALLTAASNIPDFPSSEWVLAGSVIDTVPGHGGSTPGRLQFRSISWQPGQPGRYAVLVAASCPLDRANIDPATGFPCATESGPVPRLVAFDNNLGLTVVST
jgi:hypothetical protein